MNDTDKPISQFEYADFIQNNLKLNFEQPYFFANEVIFKRLSRIYFPYRNFFHGIGVIHEGQAELLVGAERYQVKPHHIITIGPGILRQWVSGYETLQQDVMFFHSSIFVEHFQIQLLQQYPFFQPGAVHCFMPSDADYYKMSEFMTLMSKETLPEVVPGLLYSTLEFIKTISPSGSTPAGQPNDSPSHLTEAFKQLLHTYYLQNRSVRFYAEQLHVSPQYLGEAIKKVTGKSPKAWIDELLINEAKCLLKQTQLSIKEIAYYLGFEDDSYFIKKFKAMEELTPMSYRRQP